MALVCRRRIGGGLTVLAGPAGRPRSKRLVLGTRWSARCSALLGRKEWMGGDGGKVMSWQRWSGNRGHRFGFYKWIAPLLLVTP